MNSGTENTSGFLCYVSSQHHCVVKKPVLWNSTLQRYISLVNSAKLRECQTSYRTACLHEIALNIKLEPRLVQLFYISFGDCQTVQLFGEVLGNASLWSQTAHHYSNTVFSLNQEEIHCLRSPLDLQRSAAHLSHTHCRGWEMKCGIHNE